MLPRKSEDIAANEQVELCSGCGSDRGRGGRVWGVWLCGACVADWGRTAPTYADIVRMDGSEENSVAIYRAFTERWLEQRRRAA